MGKIAQSQEQHTQEPWKAVKDTVHTIAGAQIADCSFAVKAEANARRIVACVNACVDVPTEDLEQYPNVKEYIADQSDGASPERDQLREQNKELVEALQLVPALRPLLLKEMGYVPECVLKITNAARAILAKIT